MNLAQRLPLAGAVIISTPQQVALLDARRGAQMFRLVSVPLLGLVENMASYVCGGCGRREALYGESGVPAAARELGVALLGQVGGSWGWRCWGAGAAAGAAACRAAPCAGCVDRYPEREGEGGKGSAWPAPAPPSPPKTHPLHPPLHPPHPRTCCTPPLRPARS
jgi:ATP-binding protein involved in chromosome partitioning